MERFDFPRVMNNTLGLMTSIILPLALISIGGTLSFKGLASAAILLSTLFSFVCLSVALLL